MKQKTMKMAMTQNTVNGKNSLEEVVEEGQGVGEIMPVVTVSSSKMCST